MAVIAGLGVYLPQPRHTAAHIAHASGLPEQVVRDKLGLSQKTVPGPDDHTNAMGVRAGRAALDDARVGAAEVDLVMCITEEYKEYPVWTAGIKMAHDLGCGRAYAFDLGQKCGTGVLALKLAADMIKADGVSTVLIAGGYRNGDLVDYRDPNVRFLYNLAAGGGAAVVKRDGPGFEILGSAFRTDGSFSEDVIVPVGGTRAPLTPQNAADFRLRVPDPAGMKARLENKSLDNFVAVVEEACARSGIAARDVDYAAVLHMKQSAHRTVLDRLGIPESRSIYLSGYGHLGQVDPLLSLKLARDQGRLRDGAVAVLVAAGIGYVWNALCVRHRGKA
ncbi:MAG TPA: 3-oxoacyl-ACP synthase [Candidatus Binatia bacterium]|nr:3-oxoacyl-ACP synthase [Candidatus Binatia bacterium]